MCFDALFGWPFTRKVPYDQWPNVENSSQVGWVSYWLAPKSLVLHPFLSFNNLWYNESDCMPTIQVWIPNVTKQLDGNNWDNWNQNSLRHQVFSINLYICFLQEILPHLSFLGITNGFPQTAHLQLKRLQCLEIDTAKNKVNPFKTYRFLDTCSISNAMLNAFHCIKFDWACYTALLIWDWRFVAWICSKYRLNWQAQNMCNYEVALAKGVQ